eukprot:6365141-Pyramimonas_sp.AAC.2
MVLGAMIVSRRPPHKPSTYPKISRTPRRWVLPNTWGMAANSVSEFLNGMVSDKARLRLRFVAAAKLPFAPVFSDNAPRGVTVAH